MLPKSTVAGAYNYYATPFVNRLHSLQPELVTEIIQHLPPQGIEKSISDTQIIWASEMYARDNAMRHYVSRVVGVALGGEAIDAYADDLTEPELRYLRVDSELKALEQKLGTERYEELRGEVSKRKGLIIFYSKDILDHEVVPSPEADVEIAINSNEPISVSVIAGVRFLSEEEKEEAFSVIS